MTRSELKQLNRLIKLLWKAGNMADDLGLELSNGSDVGALIGSLAAELETSAQADKP
jgi:hypothetical protein